MTITKAVTRLMLDEFLSDYGIHQRFTLDISNGVFTIKAQPGKERIPHKQQSQF